MNILEVLRALYFASIRYFSGKGNVEPAVPDHNVEPAVPDHIEEQRRVGPPFYCGTAFCGHQTIAAAAKCWNSKVEALERIHAEAEELRKSGKDREAFALEQAESARYYPERDPNNWPINRSSREMQQEYIQRAERESKSS